MKPRDSNMRRQLHAMSVRRVAIFFAAFAALAPVGVSAQTEQIEYYALDAVGSVRVVFDAGGAVIGRMDYAPFGEELFNGLFVPDQRFAQLLRDGEAGLDYARARMYQVRTGRFSSVDLVFSGLFSTQEWNRYAYAGNSPLVHVDPEGLCWSCNGFMNAGARNSRGDLPHVGSTYTEVQGKAPITSTISSSLAGRFLREGSEGRERPNLPRRIRRAIREVAEKVKETVCEALPDGRAVGVSAAAGALGQGVVGVDLVINYNTGQVSGFYYQGFQAGWAGAASASFNAGLIWGLGNSNQNYSGGFSVASGAYTPKAGLGLGVGPVLAASSPPNSTRLSQPMAVGGQITASVYNTAYTGGSSKVLYSQPLDLGNVVSGAPGANFGDVVMTAITAGCK